ncbi:response regulator [Mucilaginibacter pallidiroseus]|uniref:Response regulator n=1 Tax=Mucilaginibacter pallidiroseus TaxID=2599295 RepID=A0A563UJV9_9SPHI|nr:response regulator [Mucilaginibacter pallidiroseus]TWR31558.1 response regulator [Mucilaginibacter pallidiroseus]
MDKKKILICDDDAGIVDMAQLILEMNDFEAIGETNSLKLYDRIKTEHPDLIIIDLWMPVLSGDQILKRLKSDEHFKSIPVMAISASNDGYQIAMQAGANRFISKPFEMDEFVKAAHEMVAH